jgi:hypothetical protein
MLLYYSTECCLIWWILKFDFTDVPQKTKIVKKYRYNKTCWIIIIVFTSWIRLKPVPSSLNSSLLIFVKSLSNIFFLRGEVTSLPAQPGGPDPCPFSQFSRFLLGLHGYCSCLGASKSPPYFTPTSSPLLPVAHPP